MGLGKSIFYDIKKTLNEKNMTDEQLATKMNKNIGAVNRNFSCLKRDQTSLKTLENFANALDKIIIISFEDKIL